MLRIGTQHAWLGSTENGLRMLADAGFNAVDFGFPGLPVGEMAKGEKPLASFFDKSYEEIAEHYAPLRAVAEECGIELYQAHAFFPIWDKRSEELNEYLMMALEKTMFAANCMGVQYLVVHPVRRSDKQDEWNTNMMLYRRMIPWIKKYGVKVCLENMFMTYKGRVIGTACADPEEACAYIDALNEEAGEECFAFCLDIGHANLVGKNMAETIRTLGHRLKVLHIHDNNGRTDSHMMPYTQTYNWGQDFYTDWEGMIEGLRDIGYDGSLAFETFRVMQVIPPEVRPAALRMICSIGEYWKKRIEAPAEG